MHADRAGGSGRYSRRDPGHLISVSGLCSAIRDTRPEIETLTSEFIISSRFRGPPDSGNGGYTAGLLAATMAGTVTVRLEAPPPLETPLQLRVDGERKSLVSGDRLIAEARPGTLVLADPECPPPQQVEEAGRRYHGLKQTYFPECFVCGKWRSEGDGLRIFTGPLEGTESVAGPWVPHEEFALVDGTMPVPIIWASLDCPGAWAARPSLERALVLGEMTARVSGTVRSGERCSLLGWETGHQGRKHQVATALFNEERELIALSQAVWLEIPPESFGGVNA